MIRILTDSTSDFSPPEAEALGIKLIPLTIHFGDTHYLDGAELSASRFYKLLAESSHLPKTSQPSPEQFIAEFEAARDAGDELICILLAASLSGTIQSAQIAKEEVGYDKVFIIDSCTATLGIQLLVRRALARIEQGFTAQQIVADVEESRSYLRLFAVVDTLKYLHKGGRLSTAAALAGGLLGIKPLVSLAADGSVSVIGKARGLSGAFVQIFKHIDEVGIDTEWPTAVGYTGNVPTVAPLTNYLTQKLGLPQPSVSLIGAVIGTHGGPGACGAAFFSKTPFETEEK